MTSQACSGLRVAVTLPLALLLCCWVGAAAAKSLTVSTAGMVGRSDKEAADLLRRCDKNPTTGKTRGKCSPIEAYIAKCVKAHNWRCLRCTFNTGKGVTEAESRCTQVRSPGLFVLRGGQAVCRPGVEPVAGFTKQNARKCRPGFAKKGNGNFKCVQCYGRGYTPRIGATYCRICPARYTINKLRTSCKAPATKKPAPKPTPKKTAAPKRPPPKRPPPKSPPPPPACAGLKQEIFRLDRDLVDFMRNDLHDNTPLPIGRPCFDTCSYPYDPTKPNITRTVALPTNGYCNFNGTAPCDQIAPTAVPFTVNQDRRCPGAYSSEYGGGENPPPIGGSDFLVPGLKSDYIIRWTGSITIPADGQYVFAAGADAGALLRIDGSDVLEAQGSGDLNYVFGTRTLTAGVHSFELQFYTGGENTALVLAWNWDGTQFDTTVGNQCARRRLAGFFIPGGAAFHAIPKSAFCAPYQAPPPLPP